MYAQKLCMLDHHPGISEAMGDIGNDSDSAIEDDTASSSCVSLSSSIRRGHDENDRRYHAHTEGSYWGPDDERQHEQLDIAHHIYTKLIEDKLYLAPIDDHPQRVLDLGSGTGIWTLDFADAHPSAEVIGVDLSPHAPDWIAPNCRFVIDDFNDVWPYKEKFDFIHLRGLLGSISDYRVFYKQAYQHLKPGGWIEQLEPSIEFRSKDHSVEGTNLATWAPHLHEAGKKLGRSWKTAEEMRYHIVHAGFANIKEKVYEVPFGRWPSDKKLKDLGSFNREMILTDLDGLVLRPFIKTGWEYTGVQAFLGGIRNDLRNRAIHSYHKIHVVYGQKPLESMD